MTGLLKLRFFRDITDSEREKVFQKLKVDSCADGCLQSHSLQSHLLRNYVITNDADKVWSAMVDVMLERSPWRPMSEAPEGNPLCVFSYGADWPDTWSVSRWAQRSVNAIAWMPIPPMVTT